MVSPAATRQLERNYPENSRRESATKTKEAIREKADLDSGERGMVLILILRHRCLVNQGRLPISCDAGKTKLRRTDDTCYIRTIAATKSTSEFQLLLSQQLSAAPTTNGSVCANVRMWYDE